MSFPLHKLPCAALAALFFTGWAAQAGAETPPDKAGAAPPSPLEERARAFWAARVAGDPVTAYDYEDLKFTKVMTLQMYASRGGLIYRRANVLGSDCPAGKEECLVQMEVDFVIPQMNPKEVHTQKFDDPWVLVQGQWYHAFKKRSPPPAPNAPQAPNAPKVAPEGAK